MKFQEEYKHFENISELLECSKYNQKIQSMCSDVKAHIYSSQRQTH